MASRVRSCRKMAASRIPRFHGVCFFVAAATHGKPIARLRGRSVSKLRRLSYYLSKSSDIKLSFLARLFFAPSRFPASRPASRSHRSTRKGLAEGCWSEFCCAAMFEFVVTEEESFYDSSSFVTEEESFYGRKMAREGRERERGSHIIRDDTSRRQLPLFPSSQDSKERKR